MIDFKSPFGDITLERLPKQTHQSLRAWDAADELILNHINEQALVQPNSKILIINDQFGALTSALRVKPSIHISHWGDSHVSQLATTHNLSINSLTTAVNYIKSTEQPTTDFDLILIKLPKVTALLETQINGLGQRVKTGGNIIAAGMCKHMPKSTYTLFERHIGITSTSKAAKKARLIFPSVDNITEQTLPYPITFSDPCLPIALSNEANVFSKSSLDIGARFFVQHFDKIPQAQSIIDLGCGNGVLGIMAKLTPALKDSAITFIDESFMAVACAKQNYNKAIGSLSQAQFIHSECLSQVGDTRADIILCNPPFHQQHSVGDFIAKRMFQQSYDNLNNQGELWVVANRHLAYYEYINKLFKQCHTVASNNKFIIYRAIKQP